MQDHCRNENIDVDQCVDRCRSLDQPTFGSIADGSVSCHKQFRAPLRNLSDSVRGGTDQSNGS